MVETAETDIAVVGAGIVGVACALQLARQGHRVTLVDRQAPGLGASFGNAGHLATEQVFPIADLAILKRLPRMLLDPMGPLRMDWKYLPKAMPWFTRLLLNLRPAPFQRSVAGIRTLNEGSLGAWQRLLGSIGRSELFQEDGSLLVFEKPESRQALEALRTRMQQQAVPVDFWSAETVREAAPQLSPSLLGGLFFPRTGHFIDPYRVVCELFEAAKASGVRFVQAQVDGGQLHSAGVSLASDQGMLNARQVLVSCGAHSAKLTAALTGTRVPLDTERGYHIEFDLRDTLLNRPCCPVESAFYMTPMAGRLRVAGTVELGSINDPANPKRFDYLERNVRRVMGLTQPVARRWLGFRPSLPDSLPVIGPSPNEPRMIYAFGHQHLGLTLAGATGQLVADCIAGKAPTWLDSFSVQRF